MMKYFSILSLLSVITICGYSQSGQVVTMSAGSDSTAAHIKIKWYAESVYYDYGVNIYRKEIDDKNWVKLNRSPLTKGSQLSLEAFANNHQLKTMAEITSAKSGNDLEGLVKLSVLIQSILSEQFALYLGLQFNDSTVEMGKSYEYRIMEIAKDQTESLISTTSPILADLRKPENPPSDIVLSIDEKEVGFNWKIEEDHFFAYNIYRGLSPAGVKQKLNNRPVMVTSYKDEDDKMSLPEYFFVDDSLQSGKDYYYELTGINYFGIESAHTEELHVTTIDKTPPPAPQLTNVKEERNKKLHWKQQQTDDLAGFNIYRKQISDTLYTRANDTLIAPQLNQWTIINNLSGSYLYHVEAVDLSGNTSKSEPILIDILDEVAPQPPTGLQVSLEPEIINISWEANQEPDLLGYLLFRALDKGDDVNFYPMFVEPQMEITYKQKVSANNKEKYLYKVVALDTTFNQSDFSEFVSIQLPDIIPPDTPFLKDLHVSENLIKLQWLPVFDDDLKEYLVFRSVGTDKFQQIAQLDSKRNAYTDSDVSEGIQYKYYIIARDNADNSSSSSTVLSAQISSKNTLSILGLKGKYNKKRKDLVLKWEVNNPIDAKGYVVYQSVGSGPYIPVTGLTDSMSFGSNKLRAGNTYQYQVRAYDSNGNVSRSENFEITINE